MTPFEILGITEEADDLQIKQAYLQKIRIYPPDHAPVQFQLVRDAYEKIQTREKRLAFQLFYIQEPDIQEVIAHMLQQIGTPKRPSLEAMRSALLASFRARKDK